ncbi:hypothetical protein HanPSC8_Chr17g0789441 [Helianthus annuus]|nr:hypothetical protein HanPSC8_Chr17g0789441 [Helianthus annuus]
MTRGGNPDSETIIWVILTLLKITMGCFGLKKLNKGIKVGHLKSYNSYPRVKLG